jgi:hypothetical protein
MEFDQVTGLPRGFPIGDREWVTGVEFSDPDSIDWRARYGDRRRTFPLVAVTQGDRRCVTRASISVTLPTLGPPPFRNSPFTADDHFGCLVSARPVHGARLFDAFDVDWTQPVDLYTVARVDLDDDLPPVTVLHVPGCVRLSDGCGDRPVAYQRFTSMTHTPNPPDPPGYWLAYLRAAAADVRRLVGAPTLLGSP